MTPSGTVLDLIETFRHSKTIVDGERPADCKELPRLLEKQQDEYVTRPIPKDASMKLAGKRVEPKGYDHFRNRS